MKTKTLFFLGLCTFSLCAEGAFAICYETSPIHYFERDNVPVPVGYEEILLMGDLMLGTGPNAIIAGAKHDAVYLHFNQSFGNVNVCIYNAENSLVYSTIVNTNVQQTIIIPISGNNNGAYTVVLNNANGYAEGEFIQR